MAESHRNKSKRMHGEFGRPIKIMICHHIFKALLLNVNMWTRESRGCPQEHGKPFSTLRVEVRPSLSEVILLFEKLWSQIGSPNLLGLDFSWFGKFLTFMIHVKRFYLSIAQKKSGSADLKHREEVRRDMLI